MRLADRRIATDYGFPVNSAHYSNKDCQHHLAAYGAFDADTGRQYPDFGITAINLTVTEGPADLETVVAGVPFRNGRLKHMRTGAALSGNQQTITQAKRAGRLGLIFGFSGRRCWATTF